MNIKIEVLSPTHMFLGIRFSINKLIDSLKGYDKDKEYPNVYLLEIGLLFIDIIIEKKGRI
jgi:hypothetical protein